MRIKPPPITWAVVLLWLSIAASPVRYALEWTHLSKLGSFDVGIKFDLTLVLAAYLIWKIGQGRNWARFGFLACFIAGLVPFALLVKLDLSQSPPMAGLEITGIVLQTAALVLLFITPGSDWFRPEAEPEVRINA